MATIWRRNAIYVLRPAGLFDRFDGTRVTQHAGHDVQVTQPAGCPRNGTMGQGYVNCLDCGQFVGLVSEASLTKTDIQAARGRALKRLYDRFNAQVDAQGVEGIDGEAWAKVIRTLLAPYGAGRWADAVESFAKFTEDAEWDFQKGFWGFTHGSVYFGFHTEGLVTADR